MLPSSGVKAVYENSITHFYKKNKVASKIALKKFVKTYRDLFVKFAES